MLLEEKHLSTTGIKKAVIDKWLSAINQVLIDFGIQDPKEVAAFMATITHESSNLTRLVENLNYSSSGLAATWPNRYANKGSKTPNELARKLNRNPEAIANNCYANRMGNGPESSGDGWRFRGRGPMMHTGRDAAKWLNRTVGKRYGVDFVEHFEKLEEPLYGMAGAAQYWIEVVRPHITQCLKPGSNTTNKVFMDICSDMVNRGSKTSAIGDAIGFSDRLKRFQTFIDIFNKLGEDTPPETPEASGTASSTNQWGAQYSVT